MVCRLTKRGDELREVVLLKTSSGLRQELSYHWRSAAKSIRGLVDSSRKRDKGNNQERSLGKGQPLRSPRIWLLSAEVSLMNLATGSSSRKGAPDYLPRIESMSREGGEKCTAYPNKCRMLIAVSRAVPWLKSQEQGGISWTALLAGVFTSNPRRGQAQKAWWSRE